MTNEELAGVYELVGRLRQPNECERWLFSVPFEAADMLQSLIATAREAEALRAENARLRGWSLKAFTVVEWCCGEGYALPDPHFCCDDTLMEGVPLLGVETSEEARAALEQGEAAILRAERNEP